MTSGNEITGSGSVHPGGQWKLNGSSPTETIQKLLLGGHFIQMPQGLAEVRSAQGVSFTRLFALPDQTPQYIKSSLPLAQPKSIAQSSAFQHSSPTALVGQTSMSSTVTPIFVSPVSLYLKSVYPLC